ncbi:MAG: HAMP domain-containing histidine kinase [Eubacterium sp.]|nr:HAMP domain-containing histidine kinase [Eubacterium sp.]
MKKLRRRFILSAMLSLFAVLVAIVAGMNILGYMDVVNSTNRTIKIISENRGSFPRPGEMNAVMPSSQMTTPSMSAGGDGNMTPASIPTGGDGNMAPPPMPSGGENPFDPSGEARRPDMERDFSAEAPYETRYFTVFFENGEITGAHMDNIAALTEDQAKQKATEVLENGSDSGFLEGTYRYQISYGSGQTKIDTDDENSEEITYDSMVIFVNCEKRMDAFFSTLWSSVLVSLAGMIVVFFLILITSKMVFRPVEESERKQKQFLTDASHELKTPLAIIEANTEVMELESGETKWTKSNRHQVERLSGLVEQMVALTRLDESDIGGEVEEFSFSDALRETVENYQAPAEVAGKEISMEIAENLRIRTNEKNIRQLTGILLDNAVKYATEDTTIRVRLSAKGHRATLVVYNRAEDIPVGDNEVLFERFFRLDASRNSETGGSGIGLSVARSIVEKAGGKISAHSEDGQSLTITVVLPL